MPLGYLDDPAKTARTFPVIDGIRHSVPGDRARWDADGEIELLGRDSVTINSGGEKIFAEEVEAAVGSIPRLRRGGDGPPQRPLGERSGRTGPVGQ